MENGFKMNSSHHFFLNSCSLVIFNQNHLHFIFCIFFRYSLLQKQMGESNGGI